MFPLALATALWLGILTSISPCPLATNVAAVSFISRWFSSSIPVLLSGIIYSAGRVVTYTVLSSLIITGLIGVSNVSFFIQFTLAKFLGPLMVLVGMVLLDLLSIPLPSWAVVSRIEGCAQKWGHMGSFVLGILFALAICPVSAALFFGGLIPIAIEQRSAYAMPVVYGIGTGFPVVIVAVLIALGLKHMGKIIDRLASVQVWASRITGVIFIIVGLYEIWIAIFRS